MSFLVVRELGIDGDHLELSQTVTVEEDILINAVRPYMYKHNSPAGTIRITVYKDASELAYGELTSAEMEANDIKLATHSFAHGHFRFDLNKFLRLRPGEYEIKMTSSGYSFSEGAYFAWVQSHEDIRYSINGVPQNSFENPLTVELWRNEDAKNT